MYSRHFEVWNLPTSSGSSQHPGWQWRLGLSSCGVGSGGKRISCAAMQPFGCMESTDSVCLAITVYPWHPKAMTSSVGTSTSPFFDWLVTRIAISKHNDVHRPPVPISAASKLLKPQQTCHGHRSPRGLPTGGAQAIINFFAGKSWEIRR